MQELFTVVATNRGCAAASLSGTDGGEKLSRAVRASLFMRVLVKVLVEPKVLVAGQFLLRREE